MATAASPTDGEKKEDDRETMIDLRYTNYAYQAEIIKEPETSKLLRYIVTYPFNELGL